MRLFFLFCIPLVVSLYSFDTTREIQRKVVNHCAVDNYKFYNESIITTEKPINNYETLYEYYFFETESGSFYVADVLKDFNKSDSIVEIKLIINDEFTENDLMDEKFVIEYVQRFTLNDWKKFYYVPTLGEVNYILTHSKNSINDESTYSRLITSLNFEISQLGKEQSISPYYHFNDSNKVNEQGPLDYFMETLNKNPIQVQNSINNEYSKEPHTDNVIVNLIDKNIFKNVGQYYNAGSEWGYFAKTVQNSDKSCVTSLLLFDIELEKTDLLEAEHLTIRQVYNHNYIFSNRYNIVKKDIPNNYCIGNPELLVNIKYIDTLDDRKIKRLNPEETGYTINDDLGFCFNTVSAKFLGVGKNCDSNVIAESLLSDFFGSMLETVLNVNPASALCSFVAGVASDFITKFTFDYIDRIINPMQLAKRSDGIYESSVVSLNGAANYKIAQDKAIEEQRGLEKSVFLRFPGHDGKYKEDNNNKQTPLLFKNTNHSINYKLDLLTSESTDNYTALLIHQLKIDVFDDDSVWLFNRDPNYIDTIETEFSYIVSKDGDIKQELKENKEEQAYFFGENKGAEFTFTPKQTSTYRIVITDYLTYTHFVFNGETYDLSNIKKTDEIGNDIIRPEKNPQYFDFNLNGNDTYTICLYRKIGSSYYCGSANVKVFKIGGSIEHSGSEKFGTFYESKKTINNAFGNNLIKYVNIIEGYHTIFLNGKNGGLDTYLQLYDSDMNLIAQNDDGFSSFVSGIIGYFKPNCVYYINATFYSNTRQDDLVLNVNTGIFINLLTGDNKFIGYSIRKSICYRNMELLFSPTITSELKLYFIWEPITALEFEFKIYDLIENNEIYYTNKPLLTNPSTISFKANGLYKIVINDLYDPTGYTKGILLTGEKV